MLGLTYPSWPQWYITYGEEEWRALAEKCLAQLDTFSDEIRNAFKGAFDWMKQWACSRLYGLGTKLPWDPVYLIDSLSDSTIYMAYYTIAHFLHSDLNGHKIGAGNIKASSMTPAVFDYIFLGKDIPSDTDISHDILKKMRAEFTYWYPVDLRVSGKDLVPNHLLFFIYNHVAMFPEVRKNFFALAMASNLTNVVMPPNDRANGLREFAPMATSFLTEKRCQRALVTS